MSAFLDLVAFSAVMLLPALAYVATGWVMEKHR